MSIESWEIPPGAVLEAPFWQEKIRVIASKQIGSSLQIYGKGLKSGEFFERVLSREQLATVKLSPSLKRTFEESPDGFFLAAEAKRIRYSFQFDPLFAVNVSQIDPLPHQIDAVYHYILKLPRIRFLLADDPGAGKTIMAGLLLKELKHRGLVEKILIVVPGHLKEQWLREMKEKFNENFRVVDRGVVEASWGRNVWAEEPQAISSMDFAKRDDVMPSLLEVNWDLVIVDEAHKMAAYQYGEKVSKVERYRLGELLSRNTKFLLLLTATPHRGDPNNFRLFFDLLEPGFFATSEILQESIEKKENPFFLRRLKEDLKDFEGAPLFPPRLVTTVKYLLSEDEKRLYNAVTEYVEKHYQKAIRKEKRNVAFALLILQRRLASSLRAIRRSLERRKVRLEDLHKKGQIILEGGTVDEDELEDADEAERWKKEDELLEKLTSAESLEELQDEIDRLGELIRLAKEAEKKEVETKLSQLKKVMEEEKLQKNGEKLLIFTESKDTLEYLVEKVRSWGYTVTFIHGGLSLDRRIGAEHEFRETAQVMVSTEAGGEGINLQFCWLMVNYDIPWNPNRLEQRMGRIHRYGQQNEVHIYNLVAVETREGQILERLFTKLDLMREQLGSDRVFDVIGDILLARSLQELIIDAVTNKRSMDEILKDFERYTDQEAIERAKVAAAEGLATRYIDFPRIMGETREAKENMLVPEYIEKFFLKGGERFGLRVEKRRDGLLRIPNVPFDIRTLPYDFRVKYGEVFKEYNAVTFVKEQAFKQQAEFVAPGHPLLEALVEKILEKSGEELEKGATFLDPSGKMMGLIWFLEAQISDGGDNVAGKRIFAVYQAVKEGFSLASPSVLWDLKPERSQPVDDVLRLAEDEDKVIAFSLETVIPTYLAELGKERERQAEIKTRYGLRSLQEQILKSEEKLLDYETRRAKGESLPEATIQNERRNREDLERKKGRLEQEIESEVHLLPLTPKILGVVAVQPQGLTPDELRRDEEIERIGMDVATKFELSRGWKPEDVSSQNTGYDIRSTSDTVFRYIEVKARAGEGRIALTPNEWLMAHRLADEYWLYVVTNAKGKPELYTIKNPAANVRADEHISIVRYIITDWKDAASRESYEKS